MLAIPKSDFLTAAEKIFRRLPCLEISIREAGLAIWAVNQCDSFAYLVSWYFYRVSRIAAAPALSAAGKCDGDEAVPRYDNGLYCVTFVFCGEWPLPMFR